MTADMENLYTSSNHTTSSDQSPPFEAFPQLDTGTHAGCIVQLAVTPDGRSLVSAGETTMRVWDIQDLTAPSGRAATKGVSAASATVAPSRLRRLLLGRVNGATDDGAIDGKVLRFAVSRDSRWLVALQPWRHASAPPADAALGHDAGRITEVQVFELATGNLQSRFVHPGQLLDLAFTPDGRWLALLANLRVGSAGRQRQVELLLLATRELLRPGARAAPLPAARLVVGKPRRGSTVPAALRFVPGGEVDNAAGRADRDEVTGRAERDEVIGRAERDGVTGRAERGVARLVVAIGDPAGGRGQLHWLRFSPTDGLVPERSTATAEAIAADTLAVSATMVVLAAAPPRSRKMRGRWFWFRHQGGAEGAIDTEAPPASTAFSPSGHRLAVGLMVDPLGALGSLGTPGGEDARSGMQTVQVNAYDVPAVGGPALRSTYFGHDGTVRALSFVGDDIVASAGGDNQAIHFWSPARRIAEARGAIRGVGRAAIEPGITADERVLFGCVPQRLLPPGHPIRQQSFDLRRMVLTTTAASDLRRSDVVSRKWWVGYRDDAVIPLWFVGDRERGEPTEIEPDLNLFVGADDTWVIWSRSGYYDVGGGEGAARRIGYRVNRGIAQEALLVPADRFKTFYQPDIIRAIVRHGTEARARERGVRIPTVDVAGILPPIAELARGGIRRQGDVASFVFTLQAPCPEFLPTRASLLRNGRVVWTQGQPPQRRHARCVVPALPLLPGPNRFAFHAENTQAKSVPVEFEIEGPEAVPSSGAPGRLFLLSVGVAKFIDPATLPLRFPQRDAQAVFDAFGHGRLQAATVKKTAAKKTAKKPTKKTARSGRDQERNRAFASVDARLLVNAEATKAAILAELDRMCASIRERYASAGAERDVLFVFLSGHGVRVFEHGVPNLFFQNHDMVPTAEAVDATGLSMLDLGDRITSVPAEVVLVIDACHAALAGRSTMAGLDAEELARRVHSIYERGMYLLSAARADELAVEDNSQRFGLLTASLLAALAQRHGGGARRGVSSLRLDVLMAELVAGVQRLVPVISARSSKAAPPTPVCRVYGDMVPLTILKT